MGVTDDIAEHLRIALKMLDETGHYLAAAYVSSALDTIQPDSDDRSADDDDI